MLIGVKFLAPLLRVAGHLTGGMALLFLLLTSCSAPPPDQPGREAKAAEDVKNYDSHIVLPEAPLSAEDSVALAVKNTLETSMFEREEAIRKELAHQAWYKMLPGMKVDFDRSMRNTVKATNSADLETHKESLATNFSSERGSRTYGVSMLFNVLDFGLSYYGARQAENKILIAEYDYQRVLQNLSLNATQAWWRYATAHQAEVEALVLVKAVEEQIATLDRFLADSSIQRDRGLESQKQLLQLLNKLQGFSREAAIARAGLAGVLGLKPGQEMVLTSVQVPEVKEYQLFDVPALEELALRNRPELFTEDLQEKISRDNVRMAILKLLPSPTTVLDHKWDMNPHLYANYWYSIGQKVAFDFLRIPVKLGDIKMAKMETEEVRYRRMAMAIGILSQLHLSVIEYQSAADRALSTSEIDRIQKELLEVTQLMVESGSLGKETYLTSQIYRFLARVQHMETYGLMQVAVAQIRNAIGQNEGDRRQPLPFIDQDAGRYDPLDIENLPTLAEVASCLAFTDDSIRQRARKRLLRSGEEGAAVALDILNSVDERARILAVTVVRENGSPRVVAGLLPALSDFNPDIRYQAGLALSDAFGNQSAYFHNARLEDRQAAIEQWKEYLFASGSESKH